MPTPVKLPVEVENIIHHADGVKSFIMKPLKPCPNFTPGQFLHLAIDEYDPSFHWPESRVFSIANSPTRRDKIRVTFSVKGKFTRRMFDEVCENDIIWLKLPYGSFSFPDDDKCVVFIAGGTGITPFVSFFEYAIDKKTNTKINLYYGVRSTEYFIFEPLLRECEIKLNNFEYHIFIEGNVSIKNLNNVHNGMLSIQAILEESTVNENAFYYLSGPQQMILNFKEKMVYNRINENNIIIDEWE